LPLTPPALAIGLFLILGGLGGLAFGIYALRQGGRGQRGGLGIFSERAIHTIAGVRIIVGGVVTLFFGVILLWVYFSS
jgi:hypothetical protein